jgi:hypothetical protein
MGGNMARFVAMGGNMARIVVGSAKPATAGEYPVGADRRGARRSNHLQIKIICEPLVKNSNNNRQVSLLPPYVGVW